jgi:hypothetical protein
MASAVIGQAVKVSGPCDAERVPGRNLHEAAELPPTDVRSPGSDRTAPANVPTPPGWRSSCPDRDCADLAATLAHELAHAVAHDAAAPLPRDVRAAIAASVAGIACQRFGLDPSLRSTHDVAGWLDDPDAFKLGMAAIHAAAASLIDAIDSAIVPADSLSLAA